MQSKLAGGCPETLLFQNKNCPSNELLLIHLKGFFIYYLHSIKTKLCIVNYCQSASDRQFYSFYNL